MLFNSATFLVFFVVVYALYRVLPFRAQNVMLLAASYTFYGWWDWRFLGLLVISTVVDFFVAQWMDRSAPGPARKRVLLVSLCANLGLLGFFKYYNFFVGSFSDAMGSLGWQPDVLTLEIVLPVGISFYTFQTLSYTIDVYRGDLRAERNLIDFALFVSYFPQLVAGPIERATALLPQITQPRTIHREDYVEGLWFVVWGFFLKAFVADNLGPMVDEIFAKSGVIPGSEALLSLYGFAFQIFGDFAGYSSIAIGVSRWMGIRLMTNFLFPYFVTALSEKPVETGIQ